MKLPDWVPAVRRPWNPAFRETWEAMTHQERQASLLVDLAILAAFGIVGWIGGSLL